MACNVGVSRYILVKSRSNLQYDSLVIKILNVSNTSLYFALVSDSFPF